MGNDSSTMHTSVSARFRFNCVDRSLENGKYALSDEASDRNNNTWQLALYPRGMAGTPGWTSLCLIGRRNPKKMKFSRITFVVRDGDGSLAFECRRQCKYPVVANPREIFRNVVLMKPGDLLLDNSINFENLPLKEGSKFVLEEFMKPRRDVGHEGELVIEAVIEAEQNISSSIIPANPLTQNMLRMLDSGHMADVSFDVGGEIIHAHRFVLAANAPLLADFCEESEAETPVPMGGIAPETFRLMLRYVYGAKAPDDRDEIFRVGFDLMDAANRFGLVELKLQMESTFVELVVFDVENVSQYILFAESMVCPLLKERAVSYFTARAKDVLKSETSAELRESAELMNELVMALLDSEEGARSRDPGGYADLPVDILREMLKEQNLDLDGSKDVLVSRLNSLGDAPRRPLFRLRPPPRIRPPQMGRR